MRVAKLNVVLTAKEPASLPPYAGAVLRGAFGNAFRRVACSSRDRECAACLLRMQCVYSLVFESPRPAESKIMRKYETIPRPFVIEPPIVSQHGTERSARIRVAPGERLEFGLTLIGPAVGYLPYFIYAFDQMAAQGLGPGRGRFDLTALEQAGKLLYDGPSHSLRSPVSTDVLRLARTAHECRRLTIRFSTPVRIIYNGRDTQNLDFHVLFRSLVRRIGLLSYFYSEQPWTIDYRGLIARALRIRTASANLRRCDWRRYSSRQEQVIDMEGLSGDVTYEGDLTEFVPFLRLGELVHLGKGTVFGLGKYEMEVN